MPHVEENTLNVVTENLKQETGLTSDALLEERVGIHCNCLLSGKSS